jgi:hypothetical protein
MLIISDPHPPRQSTLVGSPYGLAIRAHGVSAIHAVQAVMRAPILGCTCGVDIIDGVDDDRVVRILLPLSRRPIREEVAIVVLYAVHMVGLDDVAHRMLLVDGYAPALMLVAIDGRVLDVRYAVRHAPKREITYRGRGDRP